MQSTNANLRHIITKYLEQYLQSKQKDALNNINTGNLPLLLPMKL